jgi:hypothetical protein
MSDESGSQGLLFAATRGKGEKADKKTTAHAGAV